MKKLIALLILGICMTNCYCSDSDYVYDTKILESNEPLSAIIEKKEMKKKKEAINKYRKQQNKHGSKYYKYKKYNAEEYSNNEYNNELYESIKFPDEHENNYDYDDTSSEMTGMQNPIFQLMGQQNTGYTNTRVNNVKKV